MFQGIYSHPERTFHTAFAAVAVLAYSGASRSQPGSSKNDLTRGCVFCLGAKQCSSSKRKLLNRFYRFHVRHIRNYADRSL